MFLRRLFNRSSTGDHSLVAENARLRHRVRGLELDLARRRTDDILSTRDNLLPLPRPGSSSAKLLARNRTLQRRLQALVAERQVIAQDLVDAANEARAAGHVKLAASLRQRADAMAASIQAATQATPVEIEVVDSDILDDCAAMLMRSWEAVPDREAFASSWWARLTALAPAASARGMPQGLATLAHILVLTLAGKPEVGDDRTGPARAAAFLRSFVKVDVTDDWYGVAAESTLYALAGSLGAGWTEEVRMAWCRAIDAVARALGLPGMSGTVIFSSDEWTETSRS